MSGFYALAAMGAAVLIAALFLWAVIRGARETGAAKANEETTKRMVEAIEKEKQADAERTSRMADAAAASVSEPVSAARERMRKRPPTTR